MKSSSEKITRSKSSSTAHAAIIAAGIFLSRIAGLIRDRVFAHYFGNSDAADAFRAAFRIPNFLQNLFGEGVLSASFIPVYSNLLAHGDEKKARQTAGAILSLLIFVTSLLVLGGVLTTPWLITVIAPGFTGEKRDLTIMLVRVFFPGAGLLVWSAWCLGVLNSHGRFFMSYTAPVMWNAVMIASLIAFGGRMGQFPLAVWIAWGSVAGSAMQVIVQLPLVIRVLKGLPLSTSFRLDSVKTILRNFVPAFISRGVVQISAYIDSILASLLPTGAVAGLAYAQTIFTLPVSLFGMSVSAAELPAMSKAKGSAEEIAEYLRKRLNAGMRQIAFFIVPSSMAFLALGDIIAAAIYQTGKFTRADAVYVWGILAGSAVGLLASTLGRLYSSGFYALRDTRTPLLFAIVRVSLATVMGYTASQHLPPLLGLDMRWGAVGITASFGINGWIEFMLLRRSLNKRIGKTGLDISFTTRLWTSAALAAAAAWGVKIISMRLSLHPVILAVFSLGAYGVVYLAGCIVFKIPEVTMFSRFIPFLKK